MSTRILICDDSRTYAAGLRMLLEQDKACEVVGISPSGEHALQSVARLAPALVTMDLELPGMDGLQAIKEIMRDNPLPIVVLSASAEHGSRNAAAALAAGAVEAMSKQDVTIADLHGPAAAALRRRIQLLARARVAPIATASPGPRPPVAIRHTGTAQVIGIGASTGGPRALRTVLGDLPADFKMPVLVVQHIGAESLDALVHWLDGEIGLPVRVARDGAALGPGVWLAPDGAHLTIDPAMRVVLDRHTPAGLHRPSVDMLLESLALSFGSLAVAVVLTGMGADGAGGLGAIVAAGGLGIAQDEATSVLYSMPRAAAARGAQMVLGLNEIGPALCRLRPKIGPQ